MNRSYLLCIPFGGMTDSLNQISKCFKYATEYQRTLIINSRNSGLFFDFNEFFDFTNQKIEVVYPGDRIAEEINDRAIPCFPNIPFDNYITMNFSWSVKHLGWVEKVSNEQLTFDFNATYAQKLLIHASHGGGNFAFDLMPYLKLTDQVRSRFNTLRDRLPENYTAIHLRNTDYKADLQTFFEELSVENLEKDVYVATDDLKTVTDAKSLFSGKNVYFNDALMKLPKDAPLHSPYSYNDQHEEHTDKAKRNATINSICDLMLLAGARNLYCAKVRPTDQPQLGESESFLGGFSRLAIFLNEHPKIQLQLLN